MATVNEEEVRVVVRDRYRKIATQGGGCGCAPSCCGPSAITARKPAPGPRPG